MATPQESTSGMARPGNTGVGQHEEKKTGVVQQAVDQGRQVVEQGRQAVQQAQQQGGDVAESMLRTVDHSTKQATGTSIFHILTLGSIGASIVLFLAGKKDLAIFIGLWPPTFQALKAAAEKKEDVGRRY